jgi:hypothetical protein
MLEVNFFNFNYNSSYFQKLIKHCKCGNIKKIKEYTYTHIKPMGRDPKLDREEHSEWLQIFYQNNFIFDIRRTLNDQVSF